MHILRCSLAVLCSLPLLLAVERAAAAPVVAPGHANVLQIDLVSGATFGTGGSGSRITQMAFGPDGRLYCSSNGRGVLRFDYDPASGALTNMATVSGIDGNGIAFHANHMYLSAPYTSANGTGGLSRLIRLRNTFGPSDWGGDIQIVQGIPRDDHGVNNIQIRGDSLFVGIGVRTRNGAFQTFSGDAYGESAYGGSIATIGDLNLLSANIEAVIAGGGNPANIAGFFPANPTNAQYQALINGTNPVGASPYTSTAADKLIVHSSGTRNPFGMALDGDGNIWFTNNFQRVSNNLYSQDPAVPAQPDAFGGNGFGDDIHDQFFMAAEKGDYGYRNDNWRNQQLNGFFLPENAVDSTTFDNSAPGGVAHHNPAAPDGLGPSSSSNGLDFYDGNAFPIEYHKQAFISRWNGTIGDGGQSLTYRDLVAVDPVTGEVTQFASGFGNTIGVTADANGNLLVVDYSGSIYRVTAITPAVNPHLIEWGQDGSGDWSDRLAWSTPEDASVHLVPHQWGTARYAVSVNRPSASPLVTLDQDATIDSLTVGDSLQIATGNTLTVSQGVMVLAVGTLTNDGGLEADDIVNNGTFTSGGALAIADSFSNMDGVARLGGIQSWSAGATLDIAGRIVHLESNSGSAATGLGPAVANLTIAVAGGQLRIESSQDIKSLAADIAQGRIRIYFPTDANNLVRVYDGGVADGAVVSQAAIDDIWLQIQAGYNSGDWNGTGISTNTIVDPQTNGLGLVLVVDANNAEYLGIREMILGDINGDDFVDSGDATVMFGNLGQDGTGLDGDANYDGFIDAGDATVLFAHLGQAFQPSLAPLAVPEPGAVGLFSFGAVFAALIGRKEKGKRKK